MKYQLERIKALLAELHEFNSHDLKDLELTENGEQIMIPDEVLEEWRFIGLSNQSFVEMEFWKEGQIDDWQSWKGTVGNWQTTDAQNI